MKKQIASLIAVYAIIILLTGVAAAEPAAIAQDTRAAIMKILHVEKVLDVRTTAIEGMYEVALPNRQVVYVHPDKKLIFSGQIFDAATGKSLTAERASEISSNIANEVLSKVDKKKLFKIGTGPIELVEFTDVDCSHCRQSEQYFKGKEKIFSRYIILLAGEKSLKKTKAILGAARPGDEFIKTMAGDYDAKEPVISAAAEEKALQSLIYFKQVLEKVEIAGTPTFVWLGGMMQGLDTKFFDSLIEVNRLGDKK
ncbi:MAG: disulfide isomerase DsbC N-terminal domain-containing protein [Pelobacteraceae bacterium]